MALDERTTVEGSSVIVGYFQNGDDAHRAINELLDEGFRASDVGAAFHTGSSAESSLNAAGGKEIRTEVSPGTAGSGSGISGPASDTSAVTPAGLATGSGTMAAGASRPGAKPSGEIRHTGLPHELSREIPRTAAENIPATGGFQEESRTRSGTSSANWWDKLKHIFSNQPRSGEGLVSGTSMNYGTGEGHIGAFEPQYEYEYSGAAFESSLSGLGIERERSQYLSGELGRGGAVITVNASGRTTDAERVMERNHGSVKPEAGATRMESNQERSRVQVFGAVHRAYPEYLGSDEVTTRKAS